MWKELSGTGVKILRRIFMSSKRSIGTSVGEASKKPRRMRKGCKSNPEGARGGAGTTAPGDEGAGSEPSPDAFHLLPTPVKSHLDKKEYRVIQLGNGLKALLVSDLCKRSSQPEEEEDDSESEEEVEEEEEEEEGEDDVGDMEGSEDEMEGEGGERCAKEVTKYLAAAALTVNVGSFEDPAEIPGLMHFLEHMVFMGSQKYPKENAFDYFIKKHGGSDNAHTDMEHTTFYFEVQEKYLREGLDRFAQFFVQPLMKADAMTREREAVHSEFQMAVPQDTYRCQQLFAHLATEGHPMAKFTWGNETTLNVGIPAEELHKKLHELRHRYYSAQYMTLAVQARLSLDELQEFVTSIFSHIPNNGLPCPSYEQHPFPFPPKRFHCLNRIVPMKEYHSVEVSWALPTYMKHYRRNPLQYISFFMGHEGKGSILSYLKKKVWAVGVYSGNDESGFEHNTTYANMSISVELTNEGFKNIEKVLLVIFQYVDMLRRTGPVESIFREIQRTQALSFEYAEETTAMQNVESLAENMRVYAPHDYLSGDTLMPEYDPELIKNCLSELVPEKCNVMLSSKSFEGEEVCNLTEQWFGTKYSHEEIPSAWVGEWQNPPANPELFCPAPNTFIPDQFTMLPPVDASPLPVRLAQDAWGELWYKQDQKFNLPKSYCYTYFLSDLILQSPKTAALLDLYMNLYAQHSLEDLYPVHMAQYSYETTASERGFVFKCNGFNQKLPQVLELLLHHVDTFEDHLDEKTFLEIKQQQMKSYHNSIIRPETVRNDTRLSIVQHVHWTVSDKLKAIIDLTMQEFLDEFVRKIIPTCHVKMLVQGNTTVSEAEAMYGLIKARKEKCSPKDLLPLPELQTMEVLSGRWVCRLNSFNPADTNTSVINYYQGCQGTLRTEVFNEFIQMVMDEPVFDFLRTREQLGYNVYSTNRNTYGILGLSITVNTQANKFSAQHVDERIEAFLKEFVNTVADLSDEELASLKETLTSMKQTIDLTLKEEVDRNWGEISDGEYLFDRLQRHIDLIQEITRENALEHLKRLVVGEDNGAYKKLSVQVVGATHPEKGTPPTLDHLIEETKTLKLLGPSSDQVDQGYPSGAFLSDVGGFKGRLKVYPVTKIV